MNWAVFAANIEFTVGKNGLKPACVKASNYAQDMIIFRDFLLYVYRLRITRKSLHIV
jgi:hypothetical protein